MKTALLFDLDGTLVDSARGIAVALSELSRSRGGPEVDVRLVRGLVSRGAEMLVRESLGEVAEDSVADVAAFRAILRNVPNDPATVFPGAAAVVAELAQTHPMAIVTNKPEALAIGLLRDVGLAPYFQAVVGGDTLSRAKPDAAPLLHALHRIGHMGDAVLIGDSEIDARAAAAATMPFFLYEGGYEPGGCSKLPVAGRFAHFHELIARLTLYRSPLPAVSSMGIPMAIQRYP